MTKGKDRGMQIGMGIIKLEVRMPEVSRAVEEFKQNRIKAFESLSNEVRSLVSNTINQLLCSEMTIFLGRPDQSQNKRNGYEDREYALKGVGCVRIRMPVDRKSEFKSEIIPPREQIDPRLKQDLAVLHLAGISTRTLAMMSKRILGIEVSADTVSKSLGSIEEKALTWLERPLEMDYWALFVDGTNFNMQRRGSTEKEPSLVVLGMDAKSRMSILTIQPGHKDNAASWRTVFDDLKKRGLNPETVRIGVMDGLPGLENVFKEAFPKAVTARCWVHALRNALAKAPARLTDGFKLLAHGVMYATSEKSAREAFSNLKEAMGSDAARAVSCLEKDLESLLAHYAFNKELWRTLRSTNPIERVNRELKRRTKTMETLGERTLRVVTAFVAIRLEHQWHKRSMDNATINNLMWAKRNEVESAMDTLVH